MRSTNLNQTRTADVDTTGGKSGAGSWVYRPRKHKTHHHGHKLAIQLGPKTRAILGPQFRPDAPEAFIFSPRGRGGRVTAELARRNGEGRARWPARLSPDRHRALSTWYWRSASPARRRPSGRGRPGRGGGQPHPERGAEPRTFQVRLLGRAVAARPADHGDRPPRPGTARKCGPASTPAARRAGRRPGPANGGRSSPARSMDRRLAGLADEHDAELGRRRLAVRPWPERGPWRPGRPWAAAGVGDDRGTVVTPADRPAGRRPAAVAIAGPRLGLRPWPNGTARPAGRVGLAGRLGLVEQLQPFRAAIDRVLEPHPPGLGRLDVAR